MTNAPGQETEGVVVCGQPHDTAAGRQSSCHCCCHSVGYFSLPSRRLREIADARRPRPGDHPGGPVPW